MIYFSEMWLDSQQLVGGGILVWFFDQEVDEIKTVILK